MTRWRPRATSILAIVGVLACVGLILRLAFQASGGVFATDECFHVYASSWLLAHRSLPVEFTELYSGLYYYYQPMLHVFGALWAGLLGPQALHVLPVVLHALILTVLASGALNAIPDRAGRWAALICVPNITLSSYAVRFYADILVGLEFALAVAFLIRLRASVRTRDALALGVLTGLALLTKFNGLFLPVTLVGAALVYGLRGERGLAGRLVLACGLGVLIAAPWWVRNQLLYGSALYPSWAPDMDHALYPLNRAKFSMLPLHFLRRMPSILGPWMGAAILLTLGTAAARRRFTLREGLLVAGLGGMAATAFVPMGASRHLIPYLVMTALTGAWGVHAAVRERAGLALGIEAVLVTLSLYTVAVLPDYRRAADLPSYLRQAFEQVAAHAPRDARVLSVWTYDTFYYSGRAATWPNPWGQRGHPVAMFYDTDPDSCLAHLERSRIDYVLAPRTSRHREFDSANYPEAFLRCLFALAARDSTRLVWTSKALVLVRVAPGAPAPAPAAGGQVSARPPTGSPETPRR